MNIVTDEEYKDALAKAWELFDSAPGSPEENLLGELSLAIEEYEDRVYGVIQ